MPYVARDDQGRITDVQENETERAYEQAKSILDTHETKPLIPGAKETIDGLLAEFEEKFA